MLGGLCPGVVSVRGGVCLGRGVSIWKEGSLSGEGVSVSGGVSVWGGGLCPREGSLSGEGVCVWGSQPGGGLCPREWSLVQGGLCPGSLVQGGLCHRDPPYGNERAVRILLECILVRITYSSDFGASGFLRGKNVYHWILIRLAILPMGN